MATKQNQADKQPLEGRIKRPRKIQKPRRNKNAFILFSCQKRAELKDKIKINSNQMMAELAGCWRMASQEEKDKYTALAEEDKQRYLDECKVFARKHPDISIGNRTKRNYSKKAVSGYGIFMSEMKEIIRSEDPGRILMADIIPKVAKLWKELSEEEVERYQQLSLARKEKSSSKKRSKSLLGKRAIGTRDSPKPKKLVKGSNGAQSPTTAHSQEELSEEFKTDTLSFDLDSACPLSCFRYDLVKSFEYSDNSFSLQNFLADDQKFDYPLSPMKLSHELSITNDAKCDDILAFKTSQFVERGADLYSFFNEDVNNFLL